MHHRGFLAVAETLANANSKDEACRRSAISRAYYAAFHAVRVRSGDRLRDYGDSEHKGAVAYAHRTWGRQGRLFMSLQDARIQSDYRLTESVNEDKLKWALQTTKKFLSETGLM